MALSRNGSNFIKTRVEEVIGRPDGPDGDPHPMATRPLLIHLAGQTGGAICGGNRDHAPIYGANIAKAVNDTQ
jgi:hypothetical protein